MDVLGMRSSQVNIENRLLHNYICLTMGGVIWGLGGGPRLTCGLYIRRLLDEYSPIYSSVTRVLFFTTAYFDCLPGWGASQIGQLYRNYTTPISHTSSNP
jgi:hypothetical protein